MRVGAPRAVADLLVTAVPELRERLAEHHVRRVWSTLVGADVARRAKPQALVEGCLTVIVDNSPWLHELTLRADELTARLRARFPAVRALRFTLGTLEEAGPSAAPRRRPRSSAPLGAADLPAIRDAAAFRALAGHPGPRVPRVRGRADGRAGGAVHRGDPRAPGGPQARSELGLSLDHARAVARAHRRGRRGACRRAARRRTRAGRGRVPHDARRAAARAKEVGRGRGGAREGHRPEPECRGPLSDARALPGRR